MEQGSGVLGELEYEDGDEPVSTWADCRWRWSGIVMEESMLSIAVITGGEAMLSSGLKAGGTNKRGGGQRYEAGRLLLPR